MQPALPANGHLRFVHRIVLWDPKIWILDVSLNQAEHPQGLPVPSGGYHATRKHRGRGNNVSLNLRGNGLETSSSSEELEDFKEFAIS